MGKSIKQRSETIYIPPYIGNLIFGIIILCAYILLVFLDGKIDRGSIAEEAKAARERNCILFAACCIIVKSCFHWSIRHDCIKIHFLWMPVRVIHWDEISSAEYIHEWSTGVKLGMMKGQGIAVTLKGCPYFCPEIDALNFFSLKHPLRFIFIRFTPRNQKKYVDAFMKYYQKLDFQIGYDKNLLDRK